MLNDDETPLPKLPQRDRSVAERSQDRGHGRSIVLAPRYLARLR